LKNRGGCFAARLDFRLRRSTGNQEKVPLSICSGITSRVTTALSAGGDTPSGHAYKAPDFTELTSGGRNRISTSTASLISIAMHRKRGMLAFGTNRKCGQISPA